MACVHALDVAGKPLHDAVALQLQRRGDEAGIDGPDLEHAGGAEYLDIAGKAREQRVQFLTDGLFQLFQLLQRRGGQLRQLQQEIAAIGV